MKRKRGRGFLYKRQGVRWVDVALLPTFSLGSIAILFVFLFIEYHHWNGNCFAWQWSRKLNHLSIHPINHNTKLSQNVRFYNIKSTDQAKVGTYIDAVNMNSSTTTGNAVETERRYERNFCRKVDQTRVISMPSSTIATETMRRIPTQDNDNDAFSWYRAYEHIHALSELTTSHARDCDHMILSFNREIDASTRVVVHVAFEAFVRRLLQELPVLQTNFTMYRAGHHSLRPIEAIEDILHQIYATSSTSPSRTTMESIWSIYQYDMKDQVHGSGDDAEEIHHHNTLRGIRLLENWMNWSKQYGTLLYDYPPPVYLIVKFFSSMNTNEASMSSNLWSLYLSTITTDPFRHIDTSTYWEKNLSQRHPRIQLDCIMLQIVSRSGLEWEHYQCIILQSAIRLFCKRTNPQQIIHLYGGEESLWQALHASAKAGRVFDTSWLARLIRVSTMSNETEATTIKMIALRVQYYESLLNSNDPGSLRRMEQYLWENYKCITGLPFNSTTCKMLLTKFSKTKSISHQQQISIGRRAERFFYRTYEKLNHTHWYPDVECAYCVVESYLPPLMTQHQQVVASNSTQYLLQLRMVDQFIRHFIQQFGLHIYHQDKEEPATTSHNHSFQIFARMLAAYTDVAILTLNEQNSTKNSIQVSRQVDTLFRYFLIQYRNGKIDLSIESPNCQHLQQLCCIFQICTKTDMTNAGSVAITRHLQQNIHEYKYLLRDRIRE